MEVERVEVERVEVERVEVALAAAMAEVKVAEVRAVAVRGRAVRGSGGPRRSPHSPAGSVPFVAAAGARLVTAPPGRGRGGQW